MSKLDISSMTKRQLIEKSSTTIVLAMMVAAFVVAFSLVTLNFLWDLSGHNRRVIAAKSEASNILEGNVVSITPLQNSFNVFEAGDVKSSTVLDALPSKYDYPALATTVESLVQRSGLTMKSFSGDDQEEDAAQSQTVPTPVEIEFAFSAEGSYENLQKFIENMERTIRPMKVTDMELKGSDNNMTVTMTVLTYYQPATDLNVETRTIE